jgi:hypothetical protein
MTPSAEETAEQLARLVIDGVAPEEAEIFDVVAAAYRRDPQRLAKGAGRDEMLGFGIDTAVTLLTPVVLGAATEVMRYLAEETAGALDLRGRVQRLLSRGAAPDEQAVPVLDPDQIAAVREIVLAKCRQAAIEPDRAALVADAVAGALSATD